MDKLVKNEHFHSWMKQEILRNFLAGGIVVRCCSYNGERYAFVFINGIPLLFGDFVSFALNTGFENEPIKSKPPAPTVLTKLKNALMNIDSVENNSPYKVDEQSGFIEDNLELLWGSFDVLTEKLQAINEKQIKANWVNYHYYNGIMKTLDNLYKEFLTQEREKNDQIVGFLLSSKNSFHQQILIKLDNEYAKTFYQPYLIEGNPT